MRRTKSWAEWKIMRMKKLIRGGVIAKINTKRANSNLLKYRFIVFAFNVELTDHRSRCPNADDPRPFQISRQGPTVQLSDWLYSVF
jgi:hypothetical protein